MDQNLKRNKQILRNFMQTAYSDERLAMLLDHARAGKLSYISCCCFSGILTADHEDGKLRAQFNLTDYRITYAQLHGKEYLNIPGASAAAGAFWKLAVKNSLDDAGRRARIIPIILAELRRRSRPLPELPSADMLEYWQAKSQLNSELFALPGGITREGN